VTGFDELERGDIVWGADPLSEKGCPLLILGAPNLPAHGVQLITILISTKTYHEDSLTLRDDDYDGEPLGKRSHVLPWAIITFNNTTEVEYHMTSISNERIRDIATQSISYISA
jgi:hypothetical protein